VREGKEVTCKRAVMLVHAMGMLKETVTLTEGGDMTVERTVSKSNSNRSKNKGKR
jgi:hypothetical protein